MSINPNLIHPVKCTILKHDSSAAQDEDFKEPTTEDIWDEDNPNIVNAQVKYFTTPMQALMNGYQDNITGYLLCYLKDVDGIVSRFDKIIKIGSRTVEYYIMLEPEPRTVYNDFKFMKLPFGTSMEGTVR